MSADTASIIAGIRNTLLGDTILFHHLIESTPAAMSYLQSCADRYAELDKISIQVERKIRISMQLNREVF
jgi:hypothetical protein